LGKEFKGVLGCDYFSAYRKYMDDFGVLVQFCLAHLLRDIRFLVEHPNSRNQAYGRRVQQAMREMFAVIHRRDEYPADEFTIALQNAGGRTGGSSHVPRAQHQRSPELGGTLCTTRDKLSAVHHDAGDRADEQSAEQAIRFVVIDRLVTQGSRSEAGRRWLERIWSTMATCAQQGRSVFEFLVESVQSHFNGHPGPALLANTS